MKIAILGAGGVGGYYGGLLGRAGHEVTLLARGAHLDALRERGLEIRTPKETFVVPIRAVETAEEIGPVDVAVISVKTYSLDEIAPAADVLARQGADILPVLNGVDAPDRLIAKGLPPERVLAGLVEISAARVAPGVIELRSPFYRMVCGEREGGRVSERTERIAAAFREAGIEARASAEIQVDVWRKFAFIAAMAAACGLARSPIGAIRDKPMGHVLIERLIREVLAVGRALGIALPDDTDVKILSFVDGLAAPMKPSLLLDLEAGGRTEIDDLSGAVSRLGRKAGVETPSHDVATAVLG